MKERTLGKQIRQKKLETRFTDICRRNIHDIFGDKVKEYRSPGSDVGDKDFGNAYLESGRRFLGISRPR